MSGFHRGSPRVTADHRGARRPRRDRASLGRPSLPPATVRAALDATDETLPPFWADLAALGWLGLAIDEAHGGQGHGLAELAVVLEELGRAGAPGPFLPTVAASAVIGRFGTPAQRERWLPGLADGSTIGAVAVGASGLTVDGTGEDAVLGGEVRPVLGGALAGVLVVPAESGHRWFVLDHADVEVSPLTSLDPTRRSAAVRVHRLGVGGDRALDADGPLTIPALVGVLAAAEAVGGTAWCVDTAATHARERHQFGRPIGQFQAMEHRCADMLVSLEQAPRGGLGRRRGAEPSRRGGARRRRRAGPRPRRVLRRGQGPHPGSRRHRLHLGARRPHLVPAGDHDATAPRRPRRGARGRGPARPRSGRPSDAHGRPSSRGRGAPHPGARVRRRTEDHPGTEWNRLMADAGYLRAQLARVLGPGAEARRAARHRRGVPRGRTSGVRTWRSAPGPSPRSSPTARPNSSGGWTHRPSAAR
ncbi:MAG: acyl-CoA dehydrogenase family protein [Acidimicrobiia bacterium]|nr:acyl-CoA dehydrogenase family protein [Acidimicrobiia bacterium]